MIPCYARQERDLALLDETLCTVDAQTRRDFEVIVVDDGSPLELGRVVGAHAETKLLRQQNVGSALARNIGIALAQGRFFVFLDSDDLLLPDALETGISQLEAHPDCGFAVGPRQEMTFEGEPVGWQVPAPPQERDVYLSLLAFDWYIIPPSSVMFRREAVERVGGFRNPWGADDLDFYLRVARAFPARCYQDPPVTRYRRYSTSSSRDGDRMLRSIRAVYARQRPVVAGDREAERAYRTGLQKLTAIFTDSLVENIEDRVRAGQWSGAARSALRLGREQPARLVSVLPRAVRAAAFGGGRIA